MILEIMETRDPDLSNDVHVEKKYKLPKTSKQQHENMIRKGRNRERKNKWHSRRNDEVAIGSH